MIMMLLLTISFPPYSFLVHPTNFEFYTSNNIYTVQNPQKHVKTPLETHYFFGFYNPNRVRGKKVWWEKK